MTPRALLTAIGATAIAFAIGTAAGSVSSPATPVIANADTRQLSIPAQPEVARLTLVANQGCPITV